MQHNRFEELIARKNNLQWKANRLEKMIRPRLMWYRENYGSVIRNEVQSNFLEHGSFASRVFGTIFGGQEEKDPPRTSKNRIVAFFQRHVLPIAAPIIPLILPYVIPSSLNIFRFFRKKK